MKRIIYIFILILTCCVQSYSEDLYGEGTKWVMTYNLLYEESVYQDYVTFEINGDTIIGDVKYKKAYMLYSSSPDERMLVAVLRETVDSAIYVRAFNLEDYELGLCKEVLLYDFSKWDEGVFLFTDFIPHYEYWPEELLLTSDNVSQIVLSDTSISYSCYVQSQDFTFIRGIGCIYFWGPFFWLNNMDITSVSHIPHLYRFYRNGRLLYENSLYEPTDIISVPALGISVNQTSDGCIVTLSEPVENWTATLYDSSGVTVAIQSGSGDEIVLSTVSKGTHILTVNVGGKEYVRKILLK